MCFALMAHVKLHYGSIFHLLANMFQLYILFIISYKLISKLSLVWSLVQVLDTLFCNKDLHIH
jgi:hypothetical protein